jgi:hypothetical protein
MVGSKWTTFSAELSWIDMRKPVLSTQRDELFELYSELHLACGRAAATLRLAERWDAPENELLARFEREEDRAEAIWRRIVCLRDNADLEPGESP